jgi:DNA-binding protein HU-beta
MRAAGRPSNLSSGSRQHQETPPLDLLTGGVSVTTQGLFSAGCSYLHAEGHSVRAEWPREANIVYGRKVVNKAELIDALAVRLGDKKSASSALDALLTEIQMAVTKGDKVAITGFGVFEKRVRAARTARNPRTGESVKVKKTAVPAFRAGTSFKDQVASGKVPKAAPAARKAATKTASAGAEAARTATKAVKTTAAKTSAAKATATKAAGAKAAAAKKTVAKTTRAATAAARKATTARTGTDKTTTKKAPAKGQPRKAR